MNDRSKQYSGRPFSSSMSSSDWPHLVGAFRSGEAKGNSWRAQVVSPSHTARARSLIIDIGKVRSSVGSMGFLSDVTVAGGVSKGASRS
jgi:hypothetical protein